MPITLKCSGSSGIDIVIKRIDCSRFSRQYLKIVTFKLILLDWHYELGGGKCSWYRFQTEIVQLFHIPPTVIWQTYNKKLVVR